MNPFTRKNNAAAVPMPPINNNPTNPNLNSNKYPTNYTTDPTNLMNNNNDSRNLNTSVGGRRSRTRSSRRTRTTKRRERRYRRYRK